MKSDIKKFISMLFGIFICGLITLPAFFIIFFLTDLSVEYHMRETNMLQRFFVILGAGLPLYFIVNNRITKLNKKKIKRTK